VGDQQLGDHVVLGAIAAVPCRQEYYRYQYDAEEEDVGVVAGADERRYREQQHHDDEEREHGGLLLLLGLGLLLLGGDDLLALSGRDHPDLGLIGIVGVVVGDDILQLALGQVLRHRLGEHGLPCAGLTDQHNMSLLLRGLLDDLYSSVLTYDLIGELVRDFNVCGSLEALTFDPQIDVESVLRDRRLVTAHN